VENAHLSRRGVRLSSSFVTAADAYVRLIPWDFFAVGSLRLRPQLFGAGPRFRIPCL
jgi:hypothetical protein